MSRFCSIAKYKGYINSSKTLKRINSKRLNFTQDVNLSLKEGKCIEDSLRILDKIKTNISMVGVRLQETSQTVGVQNDLEEIKSTYKKKYIRSRHIKKEAHKLCANLQNKITNDKVFRLGTSEVVSAESNSTAFLNAEELYPILEVIKSSYKKNYIRSRHIKKEAQKLCAVLQNKITNKRSFALGGSTIVAASVTGTEKVIDPIPEPPLIPEGTEEIINQINALGESTFASLGLGGYTPVGLAQYCFEYVHVTLGVEWWVAIAIGTLVIRLVLFPLVIIAQRNAAKMNNYLPQMQLLQMKMTEARQTGNQMDAARYSQELMMFMKEKNLNPLKNMIVPLAQMPVFVSFFMALRQMCNVPVESLRTGGLWWFTDLTLPDQYFLMPIITSATLYATIELGTDSAKLSAQNMQLMKYVLRGLPLLVLPFTVNFPGAILCYWVSSNFISLVQVGFLRIPRVRDYFNIEPLRKFTPESLPMKPKGFTEGIKDSWTNIKITKELEERRRLDEIQFQRAGKGPIMKTYKYDPTKQGDPTKAAPISASKR